jgi:hypothetical protein
MINLKLIAALVMGATLVACGGSSSSDSSSSSSSEGECVNFDIFGNCIDDEDPIESQLEITTETIPFTESFTHNSFVGTQNNAAIFFSENYKALNTQYPQTIDGEELNDPNPYFHYPMAGFWQVVDGERTGQLNPELDYQLYVGDGWISISNARFSIGQALTDLVSASDSQDNDAKNRTTHLSVGNISWGEFDFSRNYRVSFCLKDSGAVPGGTGGNVEVFVDNNSGGNQDQSMHQAQSLLFREPATVLAANSGNRIVINVPGETYFMNDEGQQVGDSFGSKEVRVGTVTSFLMLRVSSGGYAVLSDLKVEYQNNLAESYEPCVADTTLYVAPPEPDVEGVPYDRNLPLSFDFTVGRDEFFGGADAQGTFLAISDKPTVPFYRSTSGISRIFINNDNNLRFGNALFTAGLVPAVPASGENPAVPMTGDIDLSQNFRIVIEIEDVPAVWGANGNTTDGFQVFLDNAGTSAAGDLALTRLVNSRAIEPGTLIINVPGAVTMNGNPINEVNGNVSAVAANNGTANSFLNFRCPGACGNAASGTEGGVEISDITIELQ